MNLYTHLDLADAATAVAALPAICTGSVPWRFLWACRRRRTLLTA